MRTEFDIAQQAVDTVLAHVDHLIEQGKSLGDAIAHASQRFGVDKKKIRLFYFDRIDRGFVTA